MRTCSVDLRWLVWRNSTEFPSVSLLGNSGGSSTLHSCLHAFIARGCVLPHIWMRWQFAPRLFTVAIQIMPTGWFPVANKHPKIAQQLIYCHWVHMTKLVFHGIRIDEAVGIHKQNNVCEERKRGFWATSNPSAFQQRMVTGLDMVWVDCGIYECTTAQIQTNACLSSQFSKGCLNLMCKRLVSDALNHDHGRGVWKLFLWGEQVLAHPS